MVLRCFRSPLSGPPPVHRIAFLVRLAYLHCIPLFRSGLLRHPQPQTPFHGFVFLRSTASFHSGARLHWRSGTAVSGGPPPFYVRHPLATCRLPPPKVAVSLCLLKLRSGTASNGGIA